MGVRKSYKRKHEFKTQQEMLRHLCRYHEAVVRDLIGPEPYDNWVKVYDYPTIQQSDLRVGQGVYRLITSFSEVNGSVQHVLEKFGATDVTPVFHPVGTRVQG